MSRSGMYEAITIPEPPRPQRDDIPVTEEQRQEAWEYIGCPNGFTPPPELLDKIARSVAVDDLGEVPQELIDIGFDSLTQHDQTEVLKFRRFMRTMGRVSSADDCPDCVEHDGNHSENYMTGER